VLIYEVTLQVEPGLAPVVERYMREHHIPRIFETGCFRRIRFAQASPARFRTSYEAEAQADLDRYLGEHAPRLRTEFQADFPSGIILTREVWAERQLWG
jgi:hypothetical protein